MALKGFIKGLLGEKEAKNDINEYFIYDKIVFNSEKFMPVILEGKCGIVDKDTLKEVLPCKYKGVYSAHTHGKIKSCYVLCTDTGKIYLNMETWKELWSCNKPMEYSYYLSGSDIAVVWDSTDKKVIFIDNKGNQIRSYTAFRAYKHMLFARDQYEKWGALDYSTGKEIGQFVYDNVECASCVAFADADRDPFYLVLRSGKYGIIDSRTGSEVIPCKYDAFKYSKDGMIPICLDDKWGFLDRDTLEEKIPCAYQDVSRFYGDYAAVKQRGKWGAINNKGEKVILSKFQNVLPTPSGLFCVWEDDITKCKIIDSKECVKYTAETKYDDLVKTGAEYLLDQLNRKGRYYDEWERVPCKYKSWDSSISRLAENLYSITYGKKKIYYNAITESEIKGFDHAYDFTYSTIIIRNNDKYGLFSLRDMKEIFPCVCEEYVKIKDATIAFKKNGKWGIFNSDGKPIIIKHTVGTKEKNNPTNINNNSNDIDIEKLIDAVVADGVIKEKEREVILKKATAAGYDADEVEILLDARLYEKQRAQKTEEKTTAQEPVVSPKKSSKQVANEADDEFSFGAKLWEPVKELLAANKVNMKAPKTDQPWCVFKFKSLDAQICLVYKKNIATVLLETYSGEEVKTVLDRKIASAPADHVLKKVQPEQSKRNKDKWMWPIDNEIDKNDSNIVKWYVDILTAIYRIIED